VTRIAALVSPHGFGHAARTSAVLSELARRRPDLGIDVVTSVPGWFFEASLEGPFRHHLRATDVGLVQPSALVEDPGATVEALERLGSEAVVTGFARELERLAPDLVLCDVSPFGLEAARRAGLPAALIENFTWDWIYSGYVEVEPRLVPWIERIAAASAGADLRIQCEPICSPLPGATRVPPVARSPRRGPAAVRARLGIAPESRMILVSMGGIDTPGAAGDPGSWRVPEGVELVVPGGGGAECRAGRDRRVLLLPHRTPVYHPDLVSAADAVVGKLGYSTVAEAFAAGTRFAYVPRPAFRESAVLERFVRGKLPALELDPEELATGRWLDRLPELLARPRPEPGAAVGAAAAAAALDSSLPPPA
jgi:hypothetical protein